MKYALIKDYYIPVNAQDESAKTTRDYASEGIATQMAYNTFNEKMRERPELVQHVLGMMAAGQEIDPNDSAQRAIATATNGVLDKAKNRALGFGLDKPVKGGKRVGIESTMDLMWAAPELKASRQELEQYEKDSSEHLTKKQEHALLALRVLVGMNLEADFVPVETTQAPVIAHIELPEMIDVSDNHDTIDYIHELQTAA